MSEKKTPTRSGKPRKSSKAAKSAITFTKVEDHGHSDKINQEQILTSIRDNLLTKSIQPDKPNEEIAGKVNTAKVVFSARDHHYSADGVEIKGWKRIDDSEQREIAQIDPYISAMISKRCSQAAIIGRESVSKFDKGVRVIELSPLSMEDFETKAEFQRARAIRTRQMRTIMTWVLNCGTTEEEILDEAYRGRDKQFKKCSFADFLVAQVRNLLTFGRCGTEIVTDSEHNLPLFFRPAPIETIYPVKDGANIAIAAHYDTADQTREEVKVYNSLKEDERPKMYSQRVNGQNINTFTDKQMKISYFQKQALWDLAGFPLSPIEQAIYMVFIHQQTLGYLRNAFVKGMASKGILSIESKDPNIQLTEEDVEELRRSFHNYVSRNDNSAATPVIAGPTAVTYIPLSANPRDMEFLQLEEHVIRALCSAFQVSPQEMGYGHLSIGQGGLTQSNKQEEIVRGEETGLRMLLDSIFDAINEILYESFPQAKELFAVAYVGVGEDTRDTVIDRHIREIQTTATLGSLWSDSEKVEGVPFGGDVPLAPTFHQFVVAKMKYGEFREHFFGEENASKKPEYDFIIDPSLNQSYQQLRVQPIKLQQEQALAGFEQQQQQLSQGELQSKMMLAQASQPQPDGASQGAEGQPPDGQAPEQQEKSLAEVYGERTQLKKSVGYYLSEWFGVNNLNA